MRYKITFVREKNSTNTVPLHHQKLINDALGPMIDSISNNRYDFNFSSLKATSKIQNGYMKLLSAKITLVISGRIDDEVRQLKEKIFEHPKLIIGRLTLRIKGKVKIEDPDFQTRMRYLCISPIVLVNPNTDAEKALQVVDPASHEFSDMLYNSVIEKMERAGFTEEQLNKYAEFEIIPDSEYLNKIHHEGKKYARQYKCSSGLPMTGYLLPFTLHAHPDVHRFIWQTGIGMLTDEGYGMLDVVK